jgi:hypothetical protein
MKFYHFGLFLIAAFVLGACNTVTPTEQSPSSTVGTSNRALLCSGCWSSIGSPKTAVYQYEIGGIFSTFGTGFTIGHPLLTMNGAIPMAMWDENKPYFPRKNCSTGYSWASKLVDNIKNVWSENFVPQFPACGKRRAIAARPTPTVSNMLFYDDTVVTGGETLWTTFGTPVPMNGLGFDINNTNPYNPEAEATVTNESNGYAVAQTYQGIPTVAFSAYLLSDPTRTSKIFLYRWQNNAWVNLGKKSDGSFDNGDNPKLAMRGGNSPVIAYRKPTQQGGSYLITVSRWNLTNMQRIGDVSLKTMFAYPDFALVLDQNGFPIVALTESKSIPSMGVVPTQLMVRRINDSGVVELLGGAPLETAGVGLSYKPSIVFFDSTLWVAYRFGNLFVKAWATTTNVWKSIGNPIVPTNLTGYSTSIDTPQIVLQPNQNPLVMFNQENRQVTDLPQIDTRYTELKAYAWTP